MGIVVTRRTHVLDRGRDRVGDEDNESTQEQSPQLVGSGCHGCVTFLCSVHVALYTANKDGIVGAIHTSTRQVTRRHASWTTNASAVCRRRAGGLRSSLVSSLYDIDMRVRAAERRKYQATLFEDETSTVGRGAANNSQSPR